MSVVAYTGKLGRSIDTSELIRMRKSSVLQSFHTNNTSYKKGLGGGLVPALSRGGLSSDYSLFVGASTTTKKLLVDIIILNSFATLTRGPAVDGGTPTSVNTYVTDGLSPSSTGIAYHIDGNATIITYS
jgi:hypothetical protein